MPDRQSKKELAPKEPADKPPPRGSKNQTHIVNVKDPASREILTAAYNEVYFPAFPIDDEREDLQKWLNRQENPDSLTNYLIIVVGENLDDPARRFIKGISVGIYYTEEQVALLAYNAIRPECQGEGLGKKMVELRNKALCDLAKTKGHELKGVFIDCNDPAKVPEGEDTLSPEKRLSIFRKWGAVRVPITYVQPALEEGKEKCDKLILMAYPHPQTGDYPSLQDALGLVRAMYRACGQADVENDPDYRIMKREVTALEMEMSKKDALDLKEQGRRPFCSRKTSGPKL